MSQIESLTDSILEAVANDSSPKECDDSLPELCADGIDPELIKEDRRRSIDYDRVGSMAKFLARALGRSADWQERIETAAPLYDIGKIAVPKEIMEKAGPLTDAEYEKVKQHTLIGAYLLSKRSLDDGGMAARIARSHHERWDGTGYPEGLEGDEIPLEARIVCVADTINAMTQDRPYREALPAERAFEVINKGAGSEFDPSVAKAVRTHHNDLQALL